MRTYPTRAPARALAPFLLAATLAMGAGPSDAREIPKSELVRVVGSDSRVGDRFGFSVSAQGSTLVVGAPGAGNGAGAAYVFVRQSPSIWVQQAKLVAPDGAPGDHFGKDVSVSADTIVVSDEFGARAAHIFYRSGGTWTRRERFASGEMVANIAVDGPRVIIVRLSGSAFVYRRNSSQRWIQQTILTSGSPQQFWTVQMSDGMAVFGALDFAAPASEPGSAYVYRSQTVNGVDQWTRVAHLRPAGYAAASHQFGAAVDIGQNRVLVGSYEEGTSVEGVSYLFERQANGTWQQVHRFGSQDELPHQCFGNDVAIHFDRALVSGPCIPDGGTEDQRSVEFFTRNPATNVWSSQDRVMIPMLGNNVALSGCGSFIGASRENAVYVQPAESC